MYERHVLAKSDGLRYLSPDANKIRHIDCFCVREERFLWSHDNNISDVLISGLQNKFESRNMFITTLGQGVTILESGSWLQLERLRSQVRGFCSDQSVECALADVG